MSQFNLVSQYPGTQDSGIGVDPYSTPGQAPPPFSTGRPRPSFATNSRRTLPRPPSWPHLDQETPGRWKFSRQSPDSTNESRVLVDMQRHIQELDDTITSGMTDRSMNIVQEIVKMLDEEQSKEGENQKSDFSKIMDAADTTFNSIARDENSKLVENLEKLLVDTRFTLSQVKSENTIVGEELEQQRKALMEKLTKMPDDVDDSFNEPTRKTNYFLEAASKANNGFGFLDYKYKVED